MFRTMAVGIGFAIWLLAALRPPAVAADVTELPKTVYGTMDPEYQFLSGQLLKAGPAAPVALFLDSGGWRSGTGRGAGQSQLGVRLNDAGFATLSVSHRTVEKYRWPAQIDDVRRAVQFVRFKSGEWNIDPERISLWGRSSGGHLSMMAGHLPDCARSGSTDPVERQSSRVRCLIAGSGPADLALLTQKMLTPGLPANPQEGEYLRKTLALLLGIAEDQVASEEGLRRLREISPLYNIRKDGPPVYLQYEGPADATDPEDPRLTWHNHTPVSGVLLARRFRELGVPYEMFMTPDLRTAGAEITRRQVEFLKKNNGL